MTTIDNYIKSLVTEIRLKAPNYIDREIKTVYLGGGTPSLMGNRQFSLILDTINEYYRLSPNAEITMEANPATIEENKLKGFIDVGLNRLSIGVQSFRASELNLLGRSHSVEEIYDTVNLLHKHKLKNFNLDLIYGIPYQTVEEWLANLEIAVSLAPTHISTYLLQLAPETPLGQQVLNEQVFMSTDETELSMYTEGCNYLEAEGFVQYEISNFSKANYKSWHNMIYWQALNYLGLGAGAVSFTANRRCINKPEIVDYINYLAAGELPPSEVLEVMDLRQLAQDAIILGLRLSAGINIADFNQRFKTDLLLTYKKPIENSIKQELLIIEKGNLKLTKKGYFLSNQVLYQFIGD